MQLKRDTFLKKNNGSITIVTMAVLCIVFIFGLSLMDLSNIYTAREQAKNASDAAALAIAQKLLFFEEEGFEELAKDIVNKGDCTLFALDISYDEVSVTAKKEIEYLFLGHIFKKRSSVYTTSKAKVVYPWDESFGKCKKLVFDF
jgi:uncharacterized membrane protein